MPVGESLMVHAITYIKSLMVKMKGYKERLGLTDFTAVPQKLKMYIIHSQIFLF